MYNVLCCDIFKLFFVCAHMCMLVIMGEKTDIKDKADLLFLKYHRIVNIVKSVKYVNFRVILALKIRLPFEVLCFLSVIVIMMDIK